MAGFHSVIWSARATPSALDAPAPFTGPASPISPSLVYWKDEAGGQSFVTEKDLIS
ncbi:hypothetical protein SAMN05216329_3250 [Curtobacterium sp. YR515]|nr:hypothetical protein SAMN05216329_3250 [Curtobacterium sp. YR515]